MSDFAKLEASRCFDFVDDSFWYVLKTQKTCNFLSFSILEYHASSATEELSSEVGLGPRQDNPDLNKVEDGPESNQLCDKRSQAKKTCK